jgi:RNA polymerase sigma-70 factor (ECF subfamily)
VELAQLMERYCDGDQAAFSALWAEASPQLLAYLSSLARHRSTAEDLLQETFLKVHRARGAYVRGADPMPWFHAIGRRVFLDHVRRVKSLRLEHGVGVEIEATLDGSRAGSEAEPLFDRDVQATVREAIDRLPPPQREAVELRLAGKMPASAGAELGVSAGAMKLRFHRAMNRLRTALATRLQT